MTPSCPIDFGFVVEQEFLNTIENAVNVGFPKDRHLGLELCGPELFGKNAGKGYDPGLNPHELNVMKDFFRNLNNWVSALIACPK
jgi:hypothetical protein